MLGFQLKNISKRGPWYEYGSGLILILKKDAPGPVLQTSINFNLNVDQ